MYNLHVSEDVFMPRRKKDGMGDWIVMLDVSGSMSDKEVGGCFGELNRLSRDGEIALRRTVVIQYTAHVVSVEYFQPGEEIVFTRNGSGGTDVSAAFREAKQLQYSGEIEPVCWLVMSDMYDCWPPPPEEDVLWISTTPLEHIARSVPPYGVVTHLQIPEFYEEEPQ